MPVVQADSTIKPVSAIKNRESSPCPLQRERLKAKVECSADVIRAWAEHDHCTVCRGVNRRLDRIVRVTYFVWLITACAVARRYAEIGRNVPCAAVV